jgi:hypothetical protein
MQHEIKRKGRSGEEREKHCKMILKTLQLS